MQRCIFCLEGIDAHNRWFSIEINCPMVMWFRWETICDEYIVPVELIQSYQRHPRIQNLFNNLIDYINELSSNP
jgi:hypothetical protein